MTGGADADDRALLIAVLAAGASSRMRGRDKLLEPIGGRPLLRVVVERALATGLPCAVSLPVGGTRWAAVADLGATALPVPDASEGMAASFRAVAAEARGRAVMACLADMPEIETGDLEALIAAWRAAPDHVVRAASAGGVPGQPVIFPARLLPRLAEMRGDRGGRDVIAGEEVVTLPLPGQRAVTDLDTPEAWAAWRARTGVSG